MIHNRYRLPGGEERAVSDIAALLSRRGHVVEVLERSSTDASRVQAARSLLSGGLDPDEVAGAARLLRADVVHAHNVHPLFGWRALAAARAAGARTVLHLHNFRLFCAIGIAYRDGAPCFRCRGRDTLPGLRLRCRGSLTEAAVYAAALHRQQPALFEHSDRFVVVSEAHGSRLRELGLPGDRTVTLPNFVAGGPVRGSIAGGGRHVRAGRRPPGRGEGLRHRDPGGAGCGRAARDRGRGTRRAAPEAAGCRWRCPLHGPPCAGRARRGARRRSSRARPVPLGGAVPVRGARRLARPASRCWPATGAACPSWSPRMPWSAPRTPTRGRERSGRCGR